MIRPRLLSSAATLFFFATRRGIVVLTATAGALHAQSIVTTGDVSPSVPNVAVWDTLSSVLVGSTGAGTLTISAGAEATSGTNFIGYATGSDGTLTVRDGGSTWKTIGGLYLGYDGKGVIRVETGGALITPVAYLGYNAAAEGSVTIAGSDSSWESGSLTVGNLGKGELRIESGGEVTGASGGVASGTGSQGMATVTGAGSKWTMSDPLSVGGGGQGEMRIEAGGEVSNRTGSIGGASGAKGVVTVTGEDSKWSNSSYLYVGSRGEAELTIAAGGEVNNDIGWVAAEAGSKGSVTVTGEGSKWVNRAAVSVGVSGEGALRIEAGGEVSSVNGSIGLGSAGTGEVTVTGEGSKWTNTGQLDVGSQGEGTLRIEAGGAVKNKLSYVGFSAGTEGTVTVTGARSLWETQVALNLGYFGKGTLRIENGGTVTSTGGSYVGFVVGSEGVVTVTGAGSTWSNTAEVIVGFQGEGRLRIENGGLVTTASFVQLSVHDPGAGTLELASGGTLEVGGTDGLRAGFGTAVFDWSGGTLRVIGSDLTTSLDATLTNSATVDTNGLNATLSGLLSGSGGLAKTGTGTLTLSGENTYIGDTVITAGTLKIGNGGTTGTLGEGNVTNNAALVFDRSNTVPVSNAISGTGTLTQQGAGTIVLSGNNTYLGGTTISAGTLQLGSHGALGTGGLMITGGTLALNGFEQTVSSLSGTGGTINLGGATSVLIVDQDLDTVFAGTMTHFGHFRKTGAGKLTLDGAITGSWSGLRISEGTLVLNGANTKVGGWADSPTYLGNATLEVGNDQALAGSALNVIGTGSRLQSNTAVTLGNAIVLDRDQGATLTIDGVNDLTLTGPIVEIGSGATGGRIIKTGAHVLTLAGNNTYSGGTTVTAGQVQFSSTDNFGTGSITLDGGGLRWATGNPADVSGRLNPLGAGGGVFDTNGNDVTFTHEVSGAGQLTKDGAGSLTLAAINTYAGGTLVLGGELVVSLAALPGDVEVGSGAFLVFDQDTDGTYSGLISGAGGVRTNGDGTVTFAAVQTYTGETRINAGALQATTVIIADRDLTTAAGAGLIFNQAGNGAYAGELSGGGGLVKLGAGTVNLTSDQTYTGPTLVNAGGLRVNGALASTSVTVGGGAFLGGSGVIAGDVVVQSGGYLRPGNSTGILTMGSLLLNAGSFTQMEINGAGVAGVDYDQIRVAGEATLGGTLELLLGGGYVPGSGDRLVLIDADSITAGSDFDVINGLGNALVFTATITDDYTLAITVVQTDYAGFALTPNQRAVARNLDSDWGNPAMQPVITYLNGLPGTALPGAFDLISPEELAALPNVTQGNARAMFSGLRQRLAEIRGGSVGASLANLNFTGRNGRLDLANSVLLAAVGDTADAIGLRALAAQPKQSPADETRGFFVSGTGTFGEGESGTAPGYEFAAGGILAGTDVRLTPDAAVGVMAGYGHTESESAGSSSTIDIETVRVGVYGTWSGIEQTWLNATAGAAYHWYDSERDALGGRASGDTEGTELNAMIEAGRDFDVGAWVFTPSAGASYLWQRIDGFTESGSLAPLTLNDQTSESLRSELALTAAYRIRSGNTVWSPYVRAGWQHEFLDTQAAVESRLASGAGGVFSVNGSSVSRDSALVGAGVQAKLSAVLDVSLSYAGELNADYQSHSVNANVRLRF